MAEKPKPAPRKRRASQKPRGTKIAGVDPSGKLTVEVKTEIVQAIRAGNYMETAARFAGISKDTFYEWLKRGREVGRGPYFDFVQEIEQALAQAEVADIDLIGRAAETQWQAAAWRLERKYPDRFGRRQRVEHATPDGKPFPVGMTFDPSKLTDAELATLQSMLEKARPEES